MILRSNLGIALLAAAGAIVLTLGVEALRDLRHRREPVRSDAISARVIDGGSFATEAAAGSLSDGGLPREDPSLGGRGVLTGRVLLDGRGAGGVRVRASGDVEKETLTDEQGRFSIAGLRAGRHALRAVGSEAAAYLDGVDVAEDGPNAVIALVLTRSPAIAGRVVDEAGAPIEGAALSLLEGEFAPLPRTTRSLATGEFRFSSVSPGRYLLAASAAGHAPVRLPLLLPSPDAQVVRLPLGAKVVGEVDDELGHPVAGVAIGLLPSEGATLLGVVLGGGRGALVEPGGELGVVRGQIPFPPVAAVPSPATPLVAASAPGSVSSARSQALAGMGEAAAGAPANLFAAPSTIGPARSPASPSASIVAKTDSARAQAGGAYQAKTDASGRFQISDLPSGKVMVVATHPAFADGRSEELTLSPGVATRVRVQLARALSLRGRVLDGRGVEAPGAELWVGGGLAAICDRKGRFELRRLAGPIDVEVRARGHAATQRRIDPAVEPSVDLLLGPVAQRVTGVVMDARGMPVAGAVVTSDSAGEHLVTTTSRSGEFALAGALNTPISLQVKHGLHQRATVAGVQPGDDVRVTLAPGGVVEGEVGAERGGMVRGARVTVQDAGGQTVGADIDRSGRFRAQGLAPGPATISAEAPGYVPSTLAVDLAEAESTGEVVLRDLRLDLVEAGALEGRVRDDRGQPVGDADVECGGQHARSDGAGKFRLPAVPTGRVILRVASSSGSAAEPAYVERDRSASVDVTVR